MTRRGPGLLDLVRTRAVDTVFPGVCFLCGGEDQDAPPSPSGVCRACRESLPLMREPLCRRCGVELISERELCTRCRSVDLAFERNVALYPYEGQVRELIHLYKIAGHRRLAHVFAPGLARMHTRWFPGIPLVPVPGRREVWRRRGWEHVDELARWMEQRAGVPVSRCLTRHSRGAQKALDFDGRLENIRGTIHARGGRVPEAAVLLDDILTTGATLSECARVLREAGCSRVCSLTVAVDE